MAGRTFAIGDIHGDPEAVRALLEKLPPLDAGDTLVFLGDYVDRGPRSADVIDFVRRELPARLAARIVTLRGNHEDAWLRVIDDGGWFGFTSPPQNGCLECLRSFLPDGVALAEEEELLLLHSGGFFPPDVTAWMRSLPHWYEDQNGIYVHAGLPEKPGGGWLHPSEADDPRRLLWSRSREFFGGYVGKPVVCGHTVTATLPPDFSQYTPEDPLDMCWAGRSAYLIDTGCGKGGFLTALELPGGQVYESRG